MDDVGKIASGKLIWRAKVPYSARAMGPLVNTEAVASGPRQPQSGTEPMRMAHAGANDVCRSLRRAPIRTIAG